MKKILLTVLFLALPVLSYAQPSIGFVQEAYDFGVVAAGTTLSHEFEFTNNGDSELVIEKISAP